MVHSYRCRTGRNLLHQVEFRCPTVWAEQLIQRLGHVGQSLPLELQEELVSIAVLMIADLKEGHSIRTNRSERYVSFILMVKRMARWQILHGDSVVGSVCQLWGRNWLLLLLRLKIHKKPL